MALDPALTKKISNYAGFFNTKDPEMLSYNLNRFVGLLTPEDKQQIWANSGQTTPFVPTAPKPAANRWASRFGGWSDPASDGGRTWVGTQGPTNTSAPPPATAPGGTMPGTVQQGGGLLSSGMTSGQTLASGTVSGAAGQPGYDPSFGTVNRATDTVAGQMEGLLSQDSPFLTRARTSAAQAANARGLSNTSMAAGAGEAAAIDASLPIAAADAGTYSTQRLANQAAVVDRLLENLKAKNISALSAQEAEQLRTLTAQKGDIDRQLQMLVGGQQSGLQTERYGLQAELDKANQKFELLRQRLSGDQASELESIRRDGMLIAQSSQSAAAMSGTMFAAMSAIMSDPNTTSAQKDAAMARMTSMYKSGLTVTGGIANIDIAGLLDWTEVNQAAAAPAAAPLPTTDALDRWQWGR